MEATFNRPHAGLCDKGCFGLRGCDPWRACAFCGKREDLFTSRLSCVVAVLLLWWVTIVLLWENHLLMDGRYHRSKK